MARGNNALLDIERLGVLPTTGLENRLLEGKIQVGDMIRWTYFVVMYNAMTMLASAPGTIDQKAPVFNAMIRTLRSVVEPIADENFRRRVAQIYKDYEREVGKKNVWFHIGYGIEMLEAIMELLVQKDIFGMDEIKVGAVVDFSKVVEGMVDKEGEENG